MHIIPATSPRAYTIVVRRTCCGFALTRILLLIVIGLTPLLLAAQAYGGSRGEARINAAKHEVQVIKSAVNMYQIDNGRYPASIADCVPKYLDKVPVDPWGNPYSYDPSTGTVSCSRLNEGMRKTASDLRAGVAAAGIIITGVSILVGAIKCFAGYRLFKFALGAAGFVLGFVLGGTLLGWLMSGGSAENVVPLLLSGLVGGCIGAGLTVSVYFIGVFLIGAYFGGIGGAVILGVAGYTLEPVVVLVLAIVGGLVALAIQKGMIIVSTAFAGAWMVVSGLSRLTTGGIHPADFLKPLEFACRIVREASVVAVGWLALGVVGVVVQYRWTSTKREEQAEPWSPPEG